jgi:hypothetical protein
VQPLWIISQTRQQLIQQYDQLIENCCERPGVQQVGYCAQQIAEKVSGSGNSDDVDRNWADSDDQSEQINIDCANCQVKDWASDERVCRYSS